MPSIKNNFAYTSQAQRAEIVEQAMLLCRQNEAELLFLTVFGSALYGTSSLNKSDLDVRGVFLPSLKSLALKRDVYSLHHSTANQNKRNSSLDVDLDLWSVQNLVLKLLPNGDIGAMDLIFAPSHQECTLYYNPVLEHIFAKPLCLFDTSQPAWIIYCMKQAKKYGIKGSRLGTLNRVIEWLKNGNYNSDLRLSVCLDELIKACGEDKFCFVGEIKGGKALNLCGKWHMAGINIGEFVWRLEQERQSYDNIEQEIDFKALSHALRAMDQMEEVLTTGKLLFPLQSRSYLFEVKQGKYTWSELEPVILRRMAEIEKLLLQASYCGRYDFEFAAQCVLKCYGEQVL